MSLSATPQLYSAEWEDCLIFQAALYLSQACMVMYFLCVCSRISRVRHLFRLRADLWPGKTIKYAAETLQLMIEMQRHTPNKHLR